MGWRFTWVSSHGSDFNYDHHVSASPDDIAAGTVDYNFASGRPQGEEMHGISVFAKGAAGDVYHTYSAYARGVDILLGTHHFLDLTPKGRNERGVMDWVRLHDRYETAAAPANCCTGAAGTAASE